MGPQFALTTSTLLLLFPFTSAFSVCPLLGPDWPVPQLVQESEVVRSALQNLTAELNNGFETGNTTNGPISPDSTTLSIALFASDVDPSSKSPFFWEYHRTAPQMEHNATAESIYRIGDLGQVLTVFAFLVEAGDGHWHEPVTKYVPELRTASNGLSTVNNSIARVDWDNISLGALASHLSGIGRDSIETSEINPRNLSIYGFPALEEEDGQVCGHAKPCSRSDFFKSFKRRAPVFLPHSTPIYSNAAFQILGYALEAMSGKSFEDILTSGITQPLGMNSTTRQTPSKSTFNAAVGDAQNSMWSADLGDAAYVTGLYSSVSDLSRLGVAMLSSSLLPDGMTRRWLHPVSATSNPVNDVGMPWEIYNSHMDHVVEVYLKLGSIGTYSSYIGLVPAYNTGFVILAAGNNESPDLNAFADIIATNILPAVIRASALQASEAYAAVYTGANNSTIEIDVDSEPGISVKKISSNGLKTRDAYAEILGIDADALSIRLFPTNLRTKAEKGRTGRYVFRAVFQDINELADAGTPTCISWMGIDSTTYGGKALDEFIFEVDEEGKAVSIEVPALKMILERQLSRDNKH